MSLQNFSETVDISTPQVLVKNISKLQKIQCLLRLNSEDQKQQTNPIPYLNVAVEILEKDPLLRTSKEIDTVMKQFNNINFFKNYLQDGCKVIQNNININPRINSDNKDIFKIQKFVVKAVIERGTIYKFKEGEFIYRKNDDSNFFYIVLQGDIGIYGQVQHQKNQQNNTLIKVLNQGDSLGNIEITLNTKRFFSAEALSSGQLLKIDKQTFNKFLRDSEQQKLDADFNFLENISIFKGWTRDNLINIYTDCISHQYKYQESVYSYGQQSHSIYIIKSGQFSVYKSKPFWYKQDEESLQNGIINNQTSIKIGKLNVLDIFGYEDIFLNSDRNHRIVCESRLGGELLVISKHSFITQIISHQPIKNYLLQKTKTDYMRPHKFIDEKPTAILGENDTIPTEEDLIQSKRNNIRMSINNLTMQKRGFSENKKKQEGNNFPITQMNHSKKTQSYSSLSQINFDDTKNTTEETYHRPKLIQTQIHSQSNPLSHKKLPFLESMKQDKIDNNNNTLKLMIKEGYFNRASAAYAHLFSHKLGIKNVKQYSQTINTEQSQPKEETDTIQLTQYNNQINIDLNGLDELRNNTQSLQNTQTQLNTQTLQNTLTQQNTQAQQNTTLNQQQSKRLSSVTTFDSPIKIRNGKTLVDIRVSRTVGGQQISDNKARKSIPQNSLSSIKDFDLLKQNQLFLSKHRFGNSLVNLHHLDEGNTTTTRNMLDNKISLNMPPLLSSTTKKANLIPFSSANNIN